MTESLSEQPFPTGKIQKKIMTKNFSDIFIVWRVREILKYQLMLVKMLLCKALWADLIGPKKRYINADIIIIIISYQAFLKIIFC